MIITYRGRYFDYNNITKESINVDDIIPALTRINRFMGHTSRPYSVAEHTIRCVKLAKKLGYTPRQQLLVLVHDFAEAYCGDVNTDLKNLLPQYKIIEEEIQNAVYERLEIEPPTPFEEVKVKVVDLTMLVIEMRDITHHNHQQKIKEVGEFIEVDVLDDEDLEIHPKKLVVENDISMELARMYDSLMKEVKEEEAKQAKKGE